LLFKKEVRNFYSAFERAGFLKKIAVARNPRGLKNPADRKFIRGILQSVGNYFFAARAAMFPNMIA
jgi:hypothetical protein